MFANSVCHWLVRRTWADIICYTDLLHNSGIETNERLFVRGTSVEFLVILPPIFLPDLGNFQGFGVYVAILPPLLFADLAIRGGGKMTRNSTDDEYESWFVAALRVSLRTKDVSSSVLYINFNTISYDNFLNIVIYNVVFLKFSGSPQLH